MCPNRRGLKETDRRQTTDYVSDRKRRCRVCLHSSTGKLKTSNKQVKSGIGEVIVARVNARVRDAG